MGRGKKMIGWVAGGVLAVVTIAALSRLHIGGGTWMFRSAALPEGWPEPTPVGQVELRRYPPYRAAQVAAEGVRGGSDAMFFALFDHIRGHDIAMTAPVAIGYDAAATPRKTSMAFLYRSREIGATGDSGTVRVADLEPQTFASIGVRGDYDDARFAASWGALEAWLEVEAGRWETVGAPRYLGYNGPFVPPFLRYGEVQIPVRARGEATAAAAQPSSQSSTAPVTTSGGR